MLAGCDLLLDNFYEFWAIDCLRYLPVAAELFKHSLIVEKVVLMNDGAVEVVLDQFGNGRLTCRSWS